MSSPKIILSLGAGVQSSTMALMFAHQEFSGQFPMPDVAVFADTQAEPDYVYEWLTWLKSKLPFPIRRVSKGSLKENIIDAINGGRFAGAPFFTETDRPGVEGRLRRQCTREFKVEPIERFARDFAGLKPYQRAPKGEVLVRQYIGISLDEAQRMKPARKKWISNEYPLIDLRMSRHDCLLWMDRNGYPRPRKSSCTFCPYHNNSLWREMKMNDPESWHDAVEIDRLIRDGVRGTKQKLYLHRSLTPLENVDLRNAEDLGQISLFGDECEGMCGV